MCRLAWVSLPATIGSSASLLMRLLHTGGKQYGLHSIHSKPQETPHPGNLHPPQHLYASDRDCNPLRAARAMAPFSVTLCPPSSSRWVRDPARRVIPKKPSSVSSGLAAARKGVHERLRSQAVWDNPDPHAGRIHGTVQALSPT